MKSKLWICGQMRTDVVIAPNDLTKGIQKLLNGNAAIELSKEEFTCWEFQGVFDTEKKAIEACRNENYFIGPVNLNEQWPDGSVKWPHCYYPKRK